MITDVLVQTCTIERQTHTKTAGRKDSGVSTIASNVVCLFEELGDAIGLAVYGRHAQALLRGWMKPGQDVEINDLITWQGITLTVTGKNVLWDIDAAVADHIELAAERTERVL